jgi:hypothetical protein
MLVLINHFIVLLLIVIFVVLVLLPYGTTCPTSNFKQNLIFGSSNFSHVALLKYNYTIINIAKPTHPIPQPKPSQQEKSTKRKIYHDN